MKSVVLLSLLGVVLTVVAQLGARGAVKPSPLFSDNAVLQQGISVPVWGTAKDGEPVTVSFQGQNVGTVASGGKWMVRLKPLKASSEPSTMTITGENTVEVKNVLVGEVWVASGQSNMQFQLKQAETGKEAIEKSKDSMIRLFTVPNVTSPTPLTEVNSSWVESDPKTAADFSAVAYFFGRDLRTALNVPIGLIDTSWGGTRVQAWTSRDHIRNITDEDRAASTNAEYAKSPHRAANLYNAMIAPLIPYAIRGAIWYQGESNAGEAWLYRTLFPTMIDNWREDWGEGDFPFLFVQLAPWQADANNPHPGIWPELREAQLLTTKKLAKTAMAVITDCGDEKDIHPKRKQPVGERLALAARAIAYNQKIVYQGPVYKSMKVKGDSIMLSFTSIGGGLEAKGGELTGFTIAGKDENFHPAQAVIVGNTVVVKSPDVPHPVAVRYGWLNYPVVNLYNKDGLPASPFRTDDFQMLTQPPKG